MSLFSKLIRSSPFDNPQVPMTAANVAYFTDLFGGGRTESNEIVNPLTAMQLTTIFAIVRILSEQVGKMPLRVYSTSASGKQVATDHPLFDLLALNPNEDMCSMVWRQAMCAQLLLWGNAYSEIVRNNAGQVIGLWPRGAWATRPVRKNGILLYETTDAGASQNRLIAKEDMLHLMYVSLDGMVGLSPVAQARQAIGADLAMDKFSSRFFSNFATPRLAITIPGAMKPEDKTKARADWEALQSGSNQHRVAILDNGMDIKTLSMPPEDAQFIQSRQFTKRELCAMYGMPPSMVADLDKAIKSNVEQQGIEFLSYTIAPLLTRFKQELQRKLVSTIGRSAGRYVIDFDTRELLRPDAASRQAFYQSGIQNGYLRPNEVREMEGLNPYEGNVGWEPIVQVNMQPLSNMLAADTIGEPAPDNEIQTEEQYKSLNLDQVYFRLFRDGMSRFLHRSKRDSAGLRACLGPILETIAESIRGQQSAESELAKLFDELNTRSLSWAVDDLDEISKAELTNSITLLKAA